MTKCFSGRHRNAPLQISQRTAEDPGASPELLHNSCGTNRQQIRLQIPAGEADAIYDD
jgi:hypothetical protein